MIKLNHAVKFFILVFFGIAIQSLLIFSPLMDTLDQYQSNFFPLDFLVLYLAVSFVYALVVSLYMYPNSIISPYYIHIGTTAFMIFAIIIHIISSNIQLSSIGQSLIVIIAEMGLFIIVGLGMTLFLRKSFGVYGEYTDLWNETYRIEGDFNLVKRIFHESLFSSYTQDELEENRLILKRNIGDVSVLLLLQPNPKSPDESILSISTCEIRFESMWKTENAKQVLMNIKRMIIGVLDDMFMRKLILDSEEKTISAKCEYLLLESKKSILSKIDKPTTKTIVTIVGSLTVGVIATIFFFTQPEPTGAETKLLSIDALISAWVGIALGILFSSGSEIKKKISKH